MSATETYAASYVPEWYYFDSLEALESDWVPQNKDFFGLTEVNCFNILISDYSAGIDIILGKCKSANLPLKMLVMRAAETRGTIF